MIKEYRSEFYNYKFDTENGDFLRWGKEYKDDPPYSDIGPEILDIEISTSCKKGCSSCYKSNTAHGKFMSVKTYKMILDKMPSVLQVALGVGDVNYSLDTLEGIFWYTKKAKGVIPNITINGDNLTNEIVDMLGKYCGAISISNYGIENTISAVKKLSRVCNQVNIHQIVSQETYWDAMAVLSYINQGYFRNLNAITFLSLKPKGNRNSFHVLDKMKRISYLVDNAKYVAKRTGVKIGFDSCFAPIILKITGNEFAESIEPCESGLFSSYINVDGEFFPCSFCEGIKDWETGLKVSEETDFLDDIWFSEKTKKWRYDLLFNSKSNCGNCGSKNVCRPCTAFDEINICKKEAY